MDASWSSRDGGSHYPWRSLSNWLPSLAAVATRPAILGCTAPGPFALVGSTLPRDAGVRVRGCARLDVRFGGDGGRRRVAVWAISSVMSRSTWPSDARSACSIAGPPASTAPLGSPFFARPIPPCRSAPRIERLDLQSPSAERKDAGRDRPRRRASPPEAFLRRRRDLGAADDAEFSWAVNNDCRELRLAFDGGGAAIEAWLAAHLGEAPPREVAGAFTGQRLLRAAGALAVVRAAADWALAGVIRRRSRRVPPLAHRHC